MASLRKELICLVVLCTFACYAADTNATTTGDEGGNGGTNEKQSMKTKCYVCNSADDKKCNDPFDSTGMEPAGCDGVCYKYLQNIEDDDTRISRGCSKDTEPTLKKRPGCMFSTGTKSVQLQICNCHDKEGCNGASDLKSVPIVMIAASIMSLIAVALH